jgi:hypothetical protein
MFQMLFNVMVLYESLILTFLKMKRLIHFFFKLLVIDFIKSIHSNLNYLFILLELYLDCSDRTFRLIKSMLEKYFLAIYLYLFPYIKLSK